MSWKAAAEWAEPEATGGSYAGATVSGCWSSRDEGAAKREEKGGGAVRYSTSDVRTEEADASEAGYWGGGD